MLIRQSLLAGLIVISPAHETQPGETRTAPANCPVTLPPEPPFVPPPPHAPIAPWQGHFWYGGEHLWAMPASDGLWHGLATPEGVGNKVFWWSIHWDWRKDLRPALSVTARALDRAAPVVRVYPATNAHNLNDIQHAMLVGVTIPTQGCWQLTGECKGHTLSYVVWAE